MSETARRAAAAMVSVAMLAGCALDRVVVPEGRDGLAVHAVLSPSVGAQYILIERVLTGRVPVDVNAARDTASPIVSGGGIPVTPESLTVTRDVDGLTFVPVRVRPGVYYMLNTFAIDCNRGTLRCRSGEIDLGGGGSAFTLRIVAGTQVVTGHTTIPGVVRAYPQIVARDSLDANSDTIEIRFPETVERARYLFRAGSPFGPFQLFTDSTRLYVPGDLVNATTDGLPPVFLPGFRQSIVVAAVDQNYFDYYRTTNSRFTGSGLISHLDGATGVFGSMKMLDTRRLEVRAPFAHPLDGRYIGGASLRDTLELWVGARVDGGRLVSGDLRAVTPNFLGSARSGVLGALDGDRLSLRVLRGDVADDVAYTMVGTVAGRRLSLVAGDRTLTFQRVAP